MMLRVTWILIGIVALCLVGPSRVAAQFCDGYCDGCYHDGGIGHFYLSIGSGFEGLDYHGCGGTAGCSLYHPTCGSGSFVEFMPDGTLESYSQLSGEELYGLLGKLDGRVVYNSSRQAIQVRSCEDPSRIVASLPLDRIQVTGLLMAADGES